MTASDWTAPMQEYLDVVLPELASLVRSCPDDVWERSMWDVEKDRDWGRPPPPMLPNGEPDPRGLSAHSALWYVTTHLLLSLDHNFSARAASWEPPPPFRKGDDAHGRLPERTYTREEVLGYIASLQDKARATLATVAADEGALAGHGRTSADWLLSGFSHSMVHFGQLQTFFWQHRQ